MAAMTWAEAFVWAVLQAQEVARAEAEKREPEVVELPDGVSERLKVAKRIYVEDLERRTRMMLACTREHGHRSRCYQAVPVEPPELDPPVVTEEDAELLCRILNVLEEVRAFPELIQEGRRLERKMRGEK